MNINKYFISEKKVLYYLIADNVVIAQVGIWSIDQKRNMVFGLVNYRAEASMFFAFILEVTNPFPNLYAVPNQSGAMVWNALKWKSQFVKIHIASLIVIKEKIKLKIWIPKYLFLNIFFVLKVAKNKSMISRRKIYYLGDLPNQIILDTF